MYIEIFTITTQTSLCLCNQWSLSHGQQRHLVIQDDAYRFHTTTQETQKKLKYTNYENTIKMQYVYE